MKLFLKNIYVLALAAAMISCNESEDLVTADAKEGGLMEVTSASNSYVVGDPDGPYRIEYYLNQGSDIKIESIDLYKTFYGTEILESSDGEDSVVAYQSDEILDQQITVDGDASQFMTVDYTFDSFREGLTTDDGELPTTDGEFNIGDRFAIRTVAHLSDGRTIEQAYTVNFTVSTRYAGTYRTVDAVYYRLGVLTYTESDWPDEMVIESVDATTYRVVEYFGPFTGNEWYFQIIDGVISYPDETPSGDAQTGNGEPFITCESNPADFSAVGIPCDNTTNIVINDDVDGEDHLIMSFGYNTVGSGPRVFYQELEKIVD